MTIRLELKSVELTSYGTLSSFLPIYDESSLAIFTCCFFMAIYFVLSAISYQPR